MARGKQYWGAVEWIVFNDDCGWLLDDDPIQSVTAAMVSDLFDVSQTQVIADLRYCAQRHKRIAGKPEWGLTNRIKSKEG